MNKKNSIVIAIIFVIIISILALENWGEPVSKLEKTKINKEEISNSIDNEKAAFENLLGTFWEKDKNNSTSSEIAFNIDGLKGTKGYFQDFDIGFKVSDKNPEQVKIKVSINVKSINTGNSIRDKALMDEDFFETEKYPYIEFYSKKVFPTDSSYIANGLLSMMGINKEVSFNFNYLGISKNTKKQKVIIFEGNLEIDRIKFGMKPVTSVGNIVKINFYCELVEKLY